MLFIDSGAFLARYLARDSYHRTAMTTWAKLSRTPLFTSVHVLDETFTLLARRAGYDFAADRAEQIYASETLEILNGEREDELQAIRLFRKFSGQQVSFTDCLSFALMKRHHIASAFTFDRHFKDAGFQVVGLR